MWVPLATRPTCLAGKTVLFSLLGIGRPNYSRRATLSLRRWSWSNTHVVCLLCLWSPLPVAVCLCAEVNLLLLPLFVCLFLVSALLIGGSWPTLVLLSPCLSISAAGPNSYPSVAPLSRHCSLYPLASSFSIPQHHRAFRQQQAPLSFPRLPRSSALTVGIWLTKIDRFGSSVIYEIRLAQNLEPIG